MKGGWEQLPAKAEGIPGCFPRDWRHDGEGRGHGSTVVCSAARWVLEGYISI